MRVAPGGCMMDLMETAPDVTLHGYGISASLIPFSEHNQCTGAVFASSMLKQATTLTAAPPNHVDHKQLPLPLITEKPGFCDLGDGAVGPEFLAQ